MPLDPSKIKQRTQLRTFKHIQEKDTKNVVSMDDECEGQRSITSHRLAYPQNTSPQKIAPAAGLALVRESLSLSAPASEAGLTKCYEGEDFPAGKPRFAHGGRHDVCGAGWTHDRVIRHEGEDPECSYETSETRNGQKLFKAAERRARESASGKHHPRQKAEPWDEAIVKKMKARQQEDEWRRCLKKKSRVPSEAAQTQLTARTHATHATAVSIAPTSCSMVTAGLGLVEADRRHYGGNGALPYGKMCLPILPEDQRADRSVVSKIQEDEDYESVIGMCRTDRLARLLRVDGEKP